MEAKDGVIDHLNNLLTIELTAINQYFVQAEMCKNWGFNRLYKRFRDVSLEEMEDAQHLIQHILYLEGVPNLQRLNQVMVGESVAEDLELTCRPRRTPSAPWWTPSATVSRCRTTPRAASCRR